MWNDCDLPLTAEGRVYHLDLKPDEICDRVLIVGDPGRAAFIASEFLVRECFSREHRGLRSFTGEVSCADLRCCGERVTVLTSGMGTGSLEIVLGELLALHSYSLSARKKLEGVEGTLRIVRVGTSGAIQDSTELGTIIISRYGLGLEAVAHFYRRPECSAECQLLETVAQQHLNFLPFSPYVVEASAKLFDFAVEHAGALGLNTCSGITASNSGFFAPQGRAFPPHSAAFDGLEKKIAGIEDPSQRLKVENMEMECSFLMWFAALQGWEALTIAPTIAHRPSGRFLRDFNNEMRQSVALALETLFTPESD